jgi:hypothetical protein
VEATITATGEYGVVEALEPLLNWCVEEWKNAYEAAKQSDQGRMPGFHCEQLLPREWRLTKEGVLARQDLAGDDEARQRAMDFILRQGFFDGQLKVSPDLQTYQYGAVRGKGKLVNYKKVELAKGSEVNLGNWDTGADAFVKAFAQFFAQQLGSSAEGQPNQQSDQPTRREGRNADTEERLKQYLSKHASNYQNLVKRVLLGDEDSRRKFRSKFGPTAIARWIAKECGVEARESEINRIKAAIDKCPTYQQRIRPVFGGNAPADWQEADDAVATQISKTMRRQAGADKCTTR